jgi:hypothetical protein
MVEHVTTDPYNTEYDESEESIRFRKPERLIDKITRNPKDCISETFMVLKLNEFREAINEWLEVAFINENCEYEEGRARWDLKDFCAELQLLAEAFHLMNEANNRETAGAWKKKLPDNIKEELEQLNQPELLNSEQKARPMLVINRFCNAFKLSYSRGELWDLQDAVISYDGEKEISKLNLLLIYECISCLVQAAFILNDNSQAIS